VVKGDRGLLRSVVIKPQMMLTKQLTHLQAGGIYKADAAIGFTPFLTRTQIESELISSLGCCVVTMKNFWEGEEWEEMRPPKQ
jgi:hypothetical protein